MQHPSKHHLLALQHTPLRKIEIEGTSLTISPLPLLPVVHRQLVSKRFRLPGNREYLARTLVRLPVDAVMRAALPDNGADFVLLLAVEGAVGIRIRRLAWRVCQF